MREISAPDMVWLTDEAQEQVRDWARDHGLDPDATYSARTIGPLVRARVYVLNSDGRKQLHPRRRDEAWMRTRWLWRRRPLPTTDTDRSST